jgi:hypothetical protein
VIAISIAPKPAQMGLPQILCNQRLSGIAVTAEGIVKAGALVLTTFLLAGLAARACSAEEGGWLPIKRADLMRLVAGEGNDTDAVKTMGREEMISILRASAKAKPEIVERAEAKWKELSDLLAPDSEVLFLSGPAYPGGLLAAGSAENIHSIRIVLVTLGLSRKEQSETVFNFLSQLFKALYPDWADAGGWPTSSLKESWATYGQRSLTDPNDVIIRKELNGITSATFGVPPDIVVFTATARAKCVPDVRRGNPFERIIC